MAVLDEHAPTSTKVSAGIRIALPCFVVILTALRLYARGPRRWRWDDAWVCAACFWTIVDTPVGIVLGERFGHLDTLQLALLYLSYFTFLCGMWSCRISLLLGIARITPGSRERRRRELISIGFVFLWCLELSQVGWTCASHSEWNRKTGVAECFSKKAIPISHLITSCFSDFILIVLPLRTLRDLKHNYPRIRIRLSLSFLASICTTALSMAAALAVLKSRGFDPMYLGSFEGYTAIIVTNLPVLVLPVCRVFGMKDTAPRQQGKTLPPIKFAPKPGGGSPDVVGIETEDISRSTFTYDWSAFANGSAPVQTDSMASATSDPRQEHTSMELTSTSMAGNNTFISRLKAFSVGVHEDEDGCDEEVKTIHEEAQFDEEVGKVIKALDDVDGTRLKGEVSTPCLRRHSMAI